MEKLFFIQRSGVLAGGVESTLSSEQIIEGTNIDNNRPLLMTHLHMISIYIIVSFFYSIYQGD